MALVCLLPAARQAIAQSLVEFEPPFTISCPAGTLARIVVANRASGELVPEAGRYNLIIPAGLRIYGDAAATVAVAGALMTRDTGYDTLWAWSDPDASADRTYILSIAASTRTLQLAFLAVPSPLLAGIRKDEGPSSGAPLHDALGRKYEARIGNRAGPKPRWSWTSPGH